MVTTKTIKAPHKCVLPSNFFEQIPDGQIEECECGQRWQMRSGRVFYKWVRVA